MKILVDARLLTSGGIGRYVREIVGRWIEAGAADAIRLLGDPAELDPWVESLAETRGGESGRDLRLRVEVRAWRAPPYHWRGQTGWARRWKEWTEGVDVVFFPHWDVPASRSGPPRVVTVHDRIHFEAPDGFPRWKRAVGERLFRRAVDGAERVLTVSEASAGELVRVLPRVEGKLEVILNGCGGSFRPLAAEDDADPLMGRWRPHRPFLLFVGPLKAHKNAALALRVLAALAEDYPELALLQVGPKEVRDPAVAELLRNPSISSRFLQAGPVNDRELRILYGLSECLLHPALIEGFGLPPLEAMACATPVVAANRASLPEVVGEGGLLLDPDHLERWVAAASRCLSEPDFRRALAERGPAQAARFSWDRTAEATLNALRAVAGLVPCSSTTRGDATKNGAGSRSSPTPSQGSSA